MNLPDTYILLDGDQQDFVDSFDTGISKEQIESIIKTFRKSIDNIDFEIDYLENQLIGDNK